MQGSTCRLHDKAEGAAVKEVGLVGWLVYFGLENQNSDGREEFLSELTYYMMDGEGPISIQPLAVVVLLMVKGEVLIDYTTLHDFKK